MISLFEQYLPALRALPTRDKYSRAELLIPSLLIDQDERMRVYFAPFDWMNTDARVILLGITPGWTQTELAYRGAKHALNAGQDAASICREAKSHGSFAGPLRKNLVRMLDEIGLSQALGLHTTGELFNTSRSLLHTSSVIRYPVFVGEANYTGHPLPTTSPLLMRFARSVLAPELAMAVHALIIPLGKAAEAVLEQLAVEGLADQQRWLSGFPHPSGANGHRVRLFRERADSLRRQIAAWADCCATAPQPALAAGGSGASATARIGSQKDGGGLGRLRRKSAGRSVFTNTFRISEDMDQESWNRLCFETKNAMAAHVAPFVTPIARSDRPEYGWAWGTGNYVQLLCTYVLTNDHVASVDPSMILSHLPSPGEPYARLGKPTLSIQRPVDIALVQVPTLPDRNDRSCLTVDMFDSQFAPADDELFFWLGHPGTRGFRNDPTVEERTYYSWFNEFTIPGYPVLTQRLRKFPNGLSSDISAAQHVALHYPNQAYETPDGTLVDVRNPHGVSGSLLWDTKRTACAKKGIEWVPALSRVCGIIWGSASSPACVIATRVEQLQQAFIGR